MKKRILYITCGIIFVIIMVYFIGYIRINSNQSEGIIVLTYHHFLPKKYKEKYYKENYYVLETEKFKQQMKYLKENNYISITPDKIECYINKKCDIPKKAFIVTIDDGNISSYYEALPILEKYGFNSINFIIGSRIGTKTIKLLDSNLNKFNFLGEDTINDIIDNHPSMTIGSHSDSLHGIDENGKQLYLTKTYEELLYDAEVSSKKLNNTKYMAYPFGGTNKDYQEALKNAKYKLAFTFNDDRKLNQDENRFLLPRINIRSDYTIDDFKNKIECKITLKEYTKRIIKKIIHRQ